MTNTVRFLESLGQDAAIKPLTPQEREQQMLAFGLDEAERDALAAADAGLLAKLAGARPQMVAVQFPGDNEPDREDAPGREDDQPDEGEERRRSDRPE